MSKNKKIPGMIIMGAISGNSEKGEVEQHVIFTNESPMKTMVRFMDADDHELFIRTVKSYNNMVSSGKKLIVNRSIILAFFGSVDAYNICTILNGKNNLGLLNYLIAGVFTFCSIEAIKQIVGVILCLLRAKPIGKAGNELIEELYPEEVSKVNAPKTLRKLFKKKKSNEEKGI